MMKPKLSKIRETINKTQDYWTKYSQTTSQLDKQIIEYLELKQEDAEITSHNNKIEITFKNVPNTKQITQLLYLSKTLGYKFQRYSLTNYAMTTQQ
ncbi:MAG: hypothetical protein IJI98_06560 [Methanosphaera sp.]|nr:hypothetical protein [Methanosphaera sp.]